MGPKGSRSANAKSFADTLHFHLKRGTRPNGQPDMIGEEWTSVAFANALGEITDRTVRNWRQGVSRPAAKDLLAVETALFGDNPAYEMWRAELRQAHGQRTLRPLRAGAMHRPNNLPFHSLGTRFKGRATTLDALRDALAEAVCDGVAVASRALYGLGGIGKTRLAIEYAWRNEEAYSALLFVPAESSKALEAGLAALSRSDVLNLSLPKAIKEAERVQAVVSWLSTNPGWLMILDNVDDEQALIAVTHWLPRLRGGHILITGRIANYPADIRAVQLPELELNAAASFLLERTENRRRKAKDDTERARELAEELGGLALGLEQAGAYIEANRIGFAAYLKTWHTARAKVTSWFRLGAVNYKHDITLATTWQTSVDRLTTQGKRLLQYLALLDSAPIPELLIDAKISGEIQNYDARESLEEIYAYSLATSSAGEISATSPSFLIHRLVQDFTRRGMAPETYTASLKITVDWIASVFEGKMDDASRWAILDPLVPHVISIASACERAQFFYQTSILLDRLAGLFQSKAKWTYAEELFRKAISITEKDPEFNYKLLIHHFNNLATLLLELNRTTEAEQLYLKSIEIRIKVGEPSGSEFGIALSNLAILFADTHRFKDAEQLFRSALAIHFKDLPPDNDQVINTKFNLASLLQQTHREHEAEPILREVIVLTEKNLGTNHPYVATMLINLSTLMKDIGNLDEAEKLARRALQIDEATLGDKHPNVGRDLNNLATLLLDSKRPSEAEPLAQRSLQINKASFGENHPSVEMNLVNLALIFIDLDQIDKAEPLARAGLSTAKSIYPSNHPRIAFASHALAVLLSKSHRARDAEPLVRNAIAIIQYNYPPQHPHLLTVVKHLAEIFRITGRQIRARQLLRNHNVQPAN